jgi:hypothetical protein
LISATAKSAPKSALSQRENSPFRAPETSLQIGLRELANPAFPRLEKPLKNAISSIS